MKEGDRGKRAHFDPAAAHEMGENRRGDEAKAKQSERSE